MYDKHLHMFTSWDISVYIIINLGLLLTFAGAHDDSNGHHPERFRRGWNPVFRCKAFDPTTTAADCSWGGKWISCESPVPPGTQANISCHAVYQSENPLSQKNLVTCNARGQWEPEPIKCITTCGMKPPSHIAPYPWHVEIYRKSSNTTARRFCGATIITQNLLLTAAHCVFNEDTKQPDSPDEFFIGFGTIFPTYFYRLDVPFSAYSYDDITVKKIYMNCGYRGLAGNYDQDIAILHVEPSINFINYITPICPNMNKSDVEVTKGEVTGLNDLSGNITRLRTSSVQVMSRDICIKEGDQKFVTADKFCVGYANETGIPNFFGDGGSALVYADYDLWHIRGIQSIGVGKNRAGCTNTTCDDQIAALFTDVSFHMEWIQAVVAQVEEGKTIPECSEGNNTRYFGITSQFPKNEEPKMIAGASICPVPPDIQNGQWKLHFSQCPSNTDHCEPREGMIMLPGTHLMYFCNEGYELTDIGGVYCTIGGEWSDIPQCREIRCKVLDTSSTKADCSLNGEWTSCATPALPRTQAEVSCRTSYRPDSIWQRNRVTCNFQGQWEPEPIKCIPVCGIKSSKNVRPLVVNGQTPVTTDFPWHATIYRTSSNSTEKKFICGATIITENLLITAAHCVFDEGIKKPENPRKFVIATGNLFRDYDYEYPPPIVVRKAQVKNIYMNCDYQGLDGNYDRDIAILHIEPSINFTSYLMPICLDTKIKSLAIDLGTNGVVAGFGRTAEGFASSILQSLSVPVVPKSVCIQESNEVNYQRFVTADKFCAGYKNGSSVCDGDSGGGLTFETNNLWYIRGIVSSGLGAITTGGTRTCDNTRYAIYTEISFHMSWIQDIMVKVELDQTIPKCSTRTKRHTTDSN